VLKQTVIAMLLTLAGVFGWFIGAALTDGQLWASVLGAVALVGVLGLAFSRWNDPSDWW
jgi:uncharacterized membrane protein YjjB (DUF3815 family)